MQSRLVFGRRVGHDNSMLHIAHEPLPQSLLSYVAFRVALRATWDALSEQSPEEARFDDAEHAGYLAEVPFLRGTTLAVQLDVLARTWSRHLQAESIAGDLLDESVVFAVCEFAAGLAEQKPERITWGLRGGPLDVSVPVDSFLASELRGLYLKLSNEGDFLLVSQFLDFPPDEAREWKQRLGIDERELEALFDTLGQNSASPEILSNLRSLTTEEETARLGRLLRVPTTPSPKGVD